MLTWLCDNVTMLTSLERCNKSRWFVQRSPQLGTRGRMDCTLSAVWSFILSPLYEVWRLCLLLCRHMAISRSRAVVLSVVKEMKPRELVHNGGPCCGPSENESQCTKALRFPLSARPFRRPSGTRGQLQPFTPLGDSLTNRLQHPLFPLPFHTTALLFLAHACTVALYTKSPSVVRGRLRVCQFHSLF